MRAPDRAAKLYPLFADLSGRAVFVVGGGAVAERKCRALLDCGARVSVGAPALTAKLARWAMQSRIQHVAGTFDEAWLDGAWLVIAATADAGVNGRVAAAAEERRIFANVVDDAELSAFHVPAVIDRSPLQIAISSGGAAPMLARSVREHLETILDHALGPLARLLARARAKVRAAFTDLSSRRAFYRRVVDGEVARLVRAGRCAEADAAFDRELRGGGSPVGRVVLVGAGPGDPGLLTLRALRALNEADVILHDRLVSRDVLDLARRDAERVDVGKQAGNHRVTQERIHALMLEHARAGKRVVRLKGGDPFIFGRGGEELEYLHEHGISHEVVPGITAALACAAYAGVPLTHRDHAQSVQFVTAHCRESLDALDWKSLAAPRQTLAIYMGVGQLAALRQHLLAAGRAADTPVVVIENGSRSEQRVIVSNLAALAGLGERHAVRSPALLVVGEVAALAERLAWFGAPPVIDSIEAGSSARPARRAAA